MSTKDMIYINRYKFTKYSKNFFGDLRPTILMKQTSKHFYIRTLSVHKWVFGHA